MSIDLKQLSARLGLSQTTVSRALNGYADVSAATRQRVAEAAQALGYQPNLAARRLARGRADAVGIVFSVGAHALGNPAFLDMLAGLTQRLEADGIDLLLAAAPEQTDLQAYERMVRGRRVDGLIVAHTRVRDPRIDYLLGTGMPFVAYGRSATAGDFPWFDFDNPAGSRLAVQALVKRGHRRIGYVHAPLAYNFAFERHAGFMAAMREAGLQPAAEAVVEGSLERRAGHAAGTRLLALKPRPTAIVVDHNIGGVGVYRACLDAGIVLGRDVSLVVNGGMPPDTLLHGQTVASVLQPTDPDTGRSLGEMILGLIEGRPLPERHVLRQPRYEDGDTVGPPPRGA